jgi:sugar transferase (PEP-CTERM/EpsH1 system associated)
MKILYVCHRFPFPPKRGGKIRPFNMIRHLHAQGHEVTVASLVRSQAEAAEGEGLAAHCTRYVMERIGPAAAVARMVARLPTSEPSSMGYFHSPRLARRVRELAREHAFDLAFVHCSSAAQYVEHLDGVPKILDFGDMDSQKWLEYARTRAFPLTLGYLLEGRKLERAEARLARRFDLCTCTTRAELETLDGYGTGAATGWFPNGVDAEYFSPAATPYDPDTICFIGRMDYYPNQEAMLRFCREVLPLLRVHRPGVRLDIVGADPSPAIRKLAELPGVRVTGSVPDVRPYVQHAALTVAPLAIARGTQNKILESLAMGVPVVTSVCAAGGVDAVPGEHLLVADRPEDWCESILALLDNPALRERFAAAGRARVLSHHSWAHSMRTLDGLIEDCLSRARRSGAEGSGRAALRAGAAAG